MSLPENKRREPSQLRKKTMWLYGAPFTGKTTLADSAPEPLMLNTDGNAEYVTAPFISIRDEVTKEGRLVKRKLAWEVFKEMVEELETKDNTFKTVVVDLAEDCYELCRLYMYDKLSITHESDDSYKAWDKVRTEYLSTMRKLMNLPYENIILISHEDTTKDLTRKSGDKVTNIKPNMQDKVANKLAGMVGFVGRVYVDNGVHKLAIKCDEVIFGGGRLGITNIEVPLEWAEIEKLFNVQGV